MHDELTLGKKPVGYKAAGVVHWVSAEHGVPVTLRHFGNLFATGNGEDVANTERETGTELSCGQTDSNQIADTQTLAAGTEPLLKNLDPSSLVEFAGVAEPSVLPSESSPGMGSRRKPKFRRSRIKARLMPRIYGSNTASI